MLKPVSVYCKIIIKKYLDWDYVLLDRVRGQDDSGQSMVLLDSK